MQLITGKWISKAIAVVADLAIPDLLAAGPREVSDLAAQRGVGADGLYRLLRAVAAFGILVELPGRRFENSPASTLMRTEVAGSMRALVRWLGEESAWRAWAGLEYSVRTGRPAYDEILGQPLFEYFKAHPETGEIFNAAMVGFTKVTGPAVARAYDFSAFETLVDVGGGHGALMAAVVNQHPRVRGVVFDRPEVVAKAPALLSAEGVADRVRVEAGDFLASVPAGANGYIMKHIIHDWDDEHCVRILSNCRTAMAPGGTVLIVEQVVSDRAEAVFSKLSDLEMLVMTPGGRERTEAEFGALVASAGLRMTRIVPTETMVSIVETVSA
jgi:hypothetical protein